MDLPVADLAGVVTALLAESSPELFTGDPPPVVLSVSSESLTFAAVPRADSPGVRRDSRVEVLSVDPQQTAGPYTLSTVPAPGHRLVRVLAGEVVAFALHDDEVAWTADPRIFRLTPRPYRSFADATGLQVVHGVDAVMVTLLADGVVDLTLSGDGAAAGRARDLALAILTLEVERLLSHVRTTEEAGDLTVSRRLTGFVVTGVTTRTNDEPGCRITAHVDMQMEIRRALREGEGVPIAGIATAGTAGPGVVVEPAVAAIRRPDDRQ